MGKKALIIVDVQNDFCEGGSLAVTGGARVAERVNTYVDAHASEYGLIVASHDWHKPHDDNGGHISSEPDYVDSWPAHCIANTHGAKLYPSLSLPARTVHIYKGYGEPSYSAFEGHIRNGDELTNVNLQTLLSIYQIDSVDIVGIALDYCVKQTALDAQKEGYNPTVLLDYTVAISTSGYVGTIASFIQAGVAVKP